MATTTTAENTKPAAAINPVIDPFSYLGMVFNVDGSITREHGLLGTRTTFDPSLPVFTEDITFNTSNNTGVRLYIHRKSLESTSSNERLPVFIYFHGGGFIIGSPASPVYHDFCSLMVVQVPVLIVSVDYRLGPEHRLPAAYLDCVEALQWIKTLPHEWIAKFGDLSNCYIMGASAGGNIAYHAPAFLRDVEISPLKIKGTILIQPFFGGTKRTESELILVKDKVLPLNVNDIMWDLALPVGADRDHEYCNLMVESELGACDWIKKLGWRVMVQGCDGDPLLDRQVELVKLMQQKGIEVVSKFDEAGCHAIEVLDPSNAKALCLAIKDFISSAA
ncbi:Alpha/beta hydrolase-3 [Heracleum sosnowskyi]|uniref:Alpha/beta hydrolase-3 n=1 Tax=Heracleum sosnowskyi TaxID=360622 RepID=A0AAD8M790_9APIA|nr:Alpha/beta hydrolase-3 [Heracleum sosnowskyi]